MISWSTVKVKTLRANHPFNIQTKLAKIDAFQYSFFVRIVKDWNNLPKHLFGHDKFQQDLKKVDECVLIQFFLYAIQ